ncbi:MAG: hypothetical protein AB7W44_10475 [Pyrinomonadaceae bacterium]
MADITEELVERRGDSPTEAAGDGSQHNGEHPRKNYRHRDTPDPKRLRTEMPRKIDGSVLFGWFSHARRAGGSPASSPLRRIPSPLRRIPSLNLMRRIPSLNLMRRNPRST